MDVLEYFGKKRELWSAVTDSYDSLAAECDIVVLEGAGSPGEINLKSHDLVNMRMADYARASVLLVGDIDRGGLYASFLGTWMSFTDAERRLLTGYIVNRFRGDASLLGPAHDYMLAHTGVPVLGTIPYIRDLNIPEEDMAGFSWGHTDCGEKKRGLWTSPWSCCGTYPITPTLRRSPPNPTSACVRCAVRRNGATPMW